MFVRSKSLILITSALLFSATIHAAPKMDANGDDEITLEEYVNYRMISFNKKDKNFDGRVTAKERRDWQAEQSREQMKAAFEQLDPDGNGRLTEDEYVEKMMSDMEGHMSMNQTAMEQDFDEMDEDKNGHISRLEYDTHINQTQDETLKMMKEAMLQQFKMMDKDKDKIITESEYAGVLDGVNALIYGDNASDSNEADNRFKESKPIALDGNGDGILTRTEQREHSNYLFELMDMNNDGVVTKQEKPYLFDDASELGVVLESQIIRR